jgi:hypothetical protein
VGFQISLWKAVEVPTEVLRVLTATTEPDVILSVPAVSNASRG